MSDSSTESVNIKATVARRVDGKIMAQVEAQDPAALQRYETDECFIVEGWHDAKTHVINPVTRRPNKRKTAFSPPPEFLLAKVKSRRNRLLERSAWATDEATPLTEACRAEWVAYRKALHEVTKDLADPAQAVFPETPGIEFAPAEAKEK